MPPKAERCLFLRAHLLVDLRRNDLGNSGWHEPITEEAYKLAKEPLMINQAPLAKLALAVLALIGMSAAAHAVPLSPDVFADPAATTQSAPQDNLALNFSQDLVLLADDDWDDRYDDDDDDDWDDRYDDDDDDWDDRYDDDDDDDWDDRWDD